MNFKLFFLISLAASALFTPIEKAFGQIPQINVREVQHLVCIKEAHHLRCTVERSKEHKQNQGAVKITSSGSSLATFVPAQNPTQQTSVAQIKQHWNTNTIVGFILLIFACSSGLGLFLYRNYRTNRVTVLRQNIEALERLWKTSNIK